MNANSTKPLFVAEPMHRKLDRGPKNISLRSSNVSNKPSAQQIKEICFHYVQKCSGKYADSKLAARYVHQMAEEILSQLAGLDFQINRIDKEPSAFLALLQEFQEAFPSSSQSPKKVAEQLKAFRAENDQLKAKIEKMEQLHRKQLTHLENAAKTQLRVYRDGITKEREYREQQLSDAVAQYKDLLAHERRMRDEQQRSVAEVASSQVRSLAQAHAAELHRANERAKMLESLLNQSEEAVRMQEEELSALRQTLLRVEEEERILLAAAGEVDGDEMSDHASRVNTIPVMGEEDIESDRAPTVVSGAMDGGRNRVMVDSAMATEPLLAHSVAVQTTELDDTLASKQRSDVGADVKYVRLARGLKKVSFYISNIARQAEVLI